MLKYQVIHRKSDITYNRYGKRHRLVNPAYLTIHGYRSYWEYGLLHRKEGEAFQWADSGGVDNGGDFYIRGKRQC